jgi:VTC domain
MPHSREIRPHAYEVKFVVPIGLANEIRRWARIELEPDPHGGGPHGDEYRTTTLYLDNLTLDVFHCRGSMGRSKYRVRRYGAAGQVFLERKMRQPAVLAKRRTIVPLVSLGQLSPSLETVVPAFDRERTTIDGGWSGGWFHRRVVARGLRPVCQVSYLRMARGFFNGGETVRLTLDCDLRARPALDYAFVEPGLPIAGPFDGAAILELKYRGPAPAIFKRLVEEFALIPRSASKYRLGMQSAVPAATIPVAPLYAPVRRSAKREGGPTELHA